MTKEKSDAGKPPQKPAPKPAAPTGNPGTKDTTFVNIKATKGK